MKFFKWLFSTIWVGFQMMTGQRKVMVLKSETPPVPLVVFRQSSRFLVLWPVVLLTWFMAFYSPTLSTNLVKVKTNLAPEVEATEVIKQDKAIEEFIAANFGAGSTTVKVSDVRTLAKAGGGYIYGKGETHEGQTVTFVRNPYTLGGWWAVLVCGAVLILRVRMRAALTLAIVALIMVFYFYLDKIGKWATFLHFLQDIRIYGNGYLYGLLALIPTIDIFVIWLYARFHYFIATPNKGFLVWGMYASERSVEYNEYELKIDVDDVVERTFGFGALNLRHRSNPSLTRHFPCVWRIAKKMSKFNEITTEVRVKTIKASETPPMET